MAKETQNTKTYSSRGLELSERIVSINRVSKVVKGGKRFRFSVLVVVGDGVSQVGLGMGKAKEISVAMKKGIEHAKKNMIDLKKTGHTLPHPIIGKFGAAEVLMRPAAPGTGVLAGSSVRPIMELGGIKDVIAKVTGTPSISPMRRWMRSSASVRRKRSTVSVAKSARKPRRYYSYG